MSELEQTNSPTEQTNSKKGDKITVLQLTLMITAAVISLRGVPLMSQVELTMFIYLIFAAVLF